MEVLKKRCQSESAYEIAQRLAKTMQCNCDLDNWEPERSTGHSHVCRIHKAALLEERRNATGIHGS